MIDLYKFTTAYLRNFFAVQEDFSPSRSVPLSETAAVAPTVADDNLVSVRSQVASNASNVFVESDLTNISAKDQQQVEQAFVDFFTGVTTDTKSVNSNAYNSQEIGEALLEYTETKPLEQQAPNVDILKTSHSYEDSVQVDLAAKEDSAETVNNSNALPMSETLSALIEYQNAPIVTPAVSGAELTVEKAVSSAPVSSTAMNELTVETPKLSFWERLTGTNPFETQYADLILTAYRFSAEYDLFEQLNADKYGEQTLSNAIFITQGAVVDEDMKMTQARRERVFWDDWSQNRREDLSRKTNEQQELEKNTEENRRAEQSAQRKSAEQRAAQHKEQSELERKREAQSQLDEKRQLTADFEKMRRLKGFI